MQGPYDSRGKKVNVVNRYDVFGRHSAMRTHTKPNEPDQVAQKPSHCPYKIHDGIHRAISGMVVRRFGNSASKSNVPAFYGGQVTACIKDILEYMQKYIYKNKNMQ